MKNTIYLGSNMSRILLKNEANEVNSIILKITTDNTANPRLEISTKSIDETVPLIAGQENTYSLPSTLWYHDNHTTITLRNDQGVAGEITIAFPVTINNDASIRIVSAFAYELKVTFNETEAIEDLQEVTESQQEQLDQVQAQVPVFVYPKRTSTAAITDGTNKNVITFDFNVTEQTADVAFCVFLTFEAETTVNTTNETYTDLNITVTYTLDGTDVAIVRKTYGDGDEFLALDHMFRNVANGNHTLVVNIAAAGGGIS